MNRKKKITYSYLNVVLDGNGDRLSYRYLIILIYVEIRQLVCQDLHRLSKSYTKKKRRNEQINSDRRIKSIFFFCGLFCFIFIKQQQQIRALT